MKLKSTAKLNSELGYAHKSLQICSAPFIDVFNDLLHRFGSQLKHVSVNSYHKK